MPLLTDSLQRFSAFQLEQMEDMARYAMKRLSAPITAETMLDDLKKEYPNTELLDLLLDIVNIAKPKICCWFFYDSPLEMKSKFCEFLNASAKALTQKKPPSVPPSSTMRTSGDKVTPPVSSGPQPLPPSPLAVPRASILHSRLPNTMQNIKERTSH